MTNNTLQTTTRFSRDVQCLKQIQKMLKVNLLRVRYHAKTKTMMTVDSFSFKSIYCAVFFRLTLGSWSKRPEKRTSVYRLPDR